MSEAVLNELPDGWEWTKLGDVVTKIIGGGTPSKNKSQYWEGDIPWLTVKDMRSRRPVDAMDHISEKAVNESSTNVIPEDTVIIATRIGLGKVIRVPYEAAINQDLKALIVPSEIDKGYLEYWFVSKTHYLESIGSGTTVKGIRLEQVRNLDFPLAPLDQQKRIVAKIEELFSHIDAGIEALKKAKQLLKQYRQSVLKAAVTGELTKEWREANKDKLEPASELLERILKERREKWEEQQFENFKAKGKIPKDDKWKKQYKDGLSPAKSDLDEIASYVIPESWSSMTVDQLTYFLTDGEHATPPRTDEGIPLLSARNVRDGWLSFEKIDHVSAETHEKLCERLKIRCGDVLLSCSGTVGRSCVAPENSNFSLVRSVAVLRPVLNNGEYMSYCLRSGVLQAQIDKKKTQTAQANIFQGKIKSLIIFVPPRSEQSEIVRLVNDKFESIERLEIETNVQLIKAERSKQSILSSAFSGFLLK